MPFLVVRFILSDDVAVVPSCWMDEEGLCAWPTHLKSKPRKLHEAIKTSSQPTCDYETYPVEILRKYDDLEAAKKLCKKIELGLLSSSGESYGKGKRRKLLNNNEDYVYLSNSDGTDSDETYCEIGNNAVTCGQTNRNGVIYDSDSDNEQSQSLLQLRKRPMNKIIWPNQASNKSKADTSMNKEVENVFQSLPLNNRNECTDTKEARNSDNIQNKMPDNVENNDENESQSLYRKRQRPANQILPWLNQTSNKVARKPLSDLSIRMPDKSKNTDDHEQFQSLPLNNRNECTNTEEARENDNVQNKMPDNVENTDENESQSLYRKRQRPANQVLPWLNQASNKVARKPLSDLNIRMPDKSKNTEVHKQFQYLPLNNRNEIDNESRVMNKSNPSQDTDNWTIGDVIKNQIKILEKLKDQEKFLWYLSGKITESVEDVEELPIENLDDVENFENFINTNDNFKKTVCYLKAYTSKDIYKSVYNVLNKIMSVNVAKYYNYCGTHPKKKFEDTGMEKLAYCTLKAAHSNMTKEIFKEYTMKWLKYAPQRFNRKKD